MASSAKRAFARRLSDRAKSVLGRYDSTLPLLSFFPNLRSSMIVGPTTEVCVEGYPRSANTFTHEALTSANPGLEIAHHVHQPAQVMRAARFGIPCVVLVRDPAPAIASLYVFNRGQSSMRRLIADYAAFYEGAYGAVASGAAAVCRFDDATASTTTASEVLNSRFGCDLNHCDLSVDALRASLARFDGEPARRAADFESRGRGETRDELVDRVGSQAGFARAQEAFEALLSADHGKRSAPTA